MLSKLCVRATHKNQCEDSLFVQEGESSIWGCVCDGCSTGIKSHFASQLICYACELTDFEISLWYRAYQIGTILKSIKEDLRLSEMNLLSTCILFEYYPETKHLFIKCLGDGVYYINGEEFIVEQNNTPDYMGYHLDNLSKYIDKYPTLHYKDVESFQICSDGIGSFQRSQFEETNKNPTILLDKPSSSNYLQRMFNVLIKDKWTIADDLTIISYYNYANQ